MLLIGRIYSIASRPFYHFRTPALIFNYFKEGSNRKLFQKRVGSKNSKETQPISKTTVARSQQQSKQTNRSPQHFSETEFDAPKKTESEGQSMNWKGDPIEGEKKRVKKQGIVQVQQIILELREAEYEQIATKLDQKIQSNNQGAIYESLIEVCLELHPQPLPSIIEVVVAHYFSASLNEKLVSTRAQELFQKFISIYTQEIVKALEIHVVDFAVSLKKWMSFTEYRLEKSDESRELSKFGRIFLEEINRKMLLCDLSTEQNLKSIETFTNYYNNKNLTLYGTQIDFFYGFCEQIPFFSPPTLIHSLILILTSRKLFNMLKSKTLKILIEIISMQTDFIVRQLPMESILNILSPMTRLVDKYYETFEDRDKMMGMIFQSILQQKLANDKHAFNLKFLKTFLGMIGGRIVLEGDSRKIRSDLFSYLFIQIRKLEGKDTFQVSNQIDLLISSLSMLFDFDIMAVPDCRKELEQLLKKVTAMNGIDEGSQAKFRCFVLQEVKKYGPGYLRADKEYILKLGTTQVYEKLSFASKSDNLEGIEQIMKIILNPRSGHYYFFFIKTRKNYFEVEAIFNDALQKLVQNNRLAVFNDVFYLNLKKIDKRSSSINQILYSLKTKNNLDLKFLWNNYYLAWIRVFQEERDQDKGKLVLSFFDTLIKLRDHTLTDQDIIYNPHFYLAFVFILDSIEKRNIQEKQTIDYFFDLLDYLLIKEQADKKMSSFLYSIVSQYRIDQLLSSSKPDKTITDIQSKLYKFRLRYFGYPQLIENITKKPLQELTDIELTQREQRLYLTAKGIKLDNASLPLLKQNLIFLLTETSLSSQQNEEIDALLQQCDEQELSEILGGLTINSIPKKKLKAVWRLFLLKLTSLQRVVWRNLFIIYSQKSQFEKEIKIFLGKIISHHTADLNEMSLLNFKIFSELLMNSQLVLEKDLLEPFVCQYAQAIFDASFNLSKEKLFNYFRPFLYSGYLLKFEYLRLLIGQISISSCSYFMLFYYEDFLEPQQFRLLLSQFLNERKRFLMQQDKIESFLCLELLRSGYPDQSTEMLSYCDGNKEKEQIPLIKPFEESVYSIVRKRYEGIISDDFYLQTEKQIIIMLQSLTQTIKRVFLLKALSVYASANNKEIRFVNIGRTLNRNQAANIIGHQLNLKAAFRTKTLNDDSDNEEDLNLELKLAEEVARMQQEAENSQHETKLKDS